MPCMVRADVELDRAEALAGIVGGIDADIPGTTGFVDDAHEALLDGIRGRDEGKRVFVCWLRVSRLDKKRGENQCDASHGESP